MSLLFERIGIGRARRHPVQVCSALLQVRYLWVFSFCFSMVVSLMFQKFLLPLLPSLHAGSGLLRQDAELYHKSAVIIADNIHMQGWQVWAIWNSLTGFPDLTGNVAILSALYAIFSVDPALIIPVNAFFQASSACLLLLIGREVWPGRVGNIAGMATAVLFIIFPTSLSWYSQPLKDVYVFCGMFLILYSWLRALRSLSGWKWPATLLVMHTAGVLLLAFVKPGYLQLLLVASGLAIFTVLARAAWRGQARHYYPLRFFVPATILVAGLLNVLHPFMSQTADKFTRSSGMAKVPGWQWQSSSWVPDKAEKHLEAMARIRAGMIQSNREVGAGSAIDLDTAPESVAEVIGYLPRALQIALFSPFPDTWLQKPNLMRLAGAGETLLWYLIAPGLLFALYFRRRQAVLLVLLYAVFFMTMLSFITPNVGTLYRYRYACEFMLMAVALGGWTWFYLARFRRTRRKLPEPVNEPEPLRTGSETVPWGETKKSLINAATLVSLLTMLSGALTFLTRDYFMARWFGMGSDMDIFYLGAMIPMFLVTTFAIPAGTAMIPVFSAVGMESPTVQSRAIGSAMFFLCILLLLVSLPLYFLWPYLFSMLNWNYGAGKLGAIQEIMSIYFLILLVSSVVMVANAALISAGKPVYSTAAQLVMPVVVFLTLLLFGASYGIYAAAYGMLAGLLANLILALYGLRRWAFLPAWGPDMAGALRSLSPGQYFLLVAASLSTALFVPVAIAIAANLPEGSVAIISLGLKILTFITSVVGMGVTAVLLPYFSRLAARLHHHQARSGLSFFLLFATMVSIPTTLALTLLVDPMVRLIFAGSAMTDANIQSLVRVIQYGLVQLPFFGCGLVAIKYILAYRRPGIILFASLAGFILAVVTGVVFSRFLGVGGIVLGMSLSMAVSTAILVFYANYLKHLPAHDSVFIVFNWVVFITLFICLHYQIYIGVVLSSGAYLLLVAGSWNAIIAHAYGDEPSFHYRSRKA